MNEQIISEQTLRKLIIKTLSNEDGLKSKLPVPSGNLFSNKIVCTENLNQIPNHKKREIKKSKKNELFRRE